MPVVKIDWWSGRTEEQKAQIIAEITDVFEKHNIPREHTTVIISDIPKTNWGIGGKVAISL